MKNTSAFLKAFTLFLCSFSLHSVAQGTGWTWAKAAGGNAYDFGSGIVTDVLGNSYVTGAFNSASISFGSNVLNNAGIATPDFFVVKYDIGGNAVWAKSFGGVYYDVAKAIATDNNGNIYITGYFASDSLVVDGTALMNYNAPNADMFVIKMTNAGTVVWAKSFGGTNWENANTIAADANGNMLIAGTFSSNTFQMGNITLTNYTPGPTDGFIAKLNNNGSVIWAKNIGGNGDEIANSVCFDFQGNCLLTGQFTSDSLRVDGFVIANDTADVYNDVFIASYDTWGNAKWVKTAGGTKDDIGYGITADGQGNVIATGAFMSNAILFGNTTLTNATAGLSDIYVVKYDSTGNMLWAKSFGGSDNDEGKIITTDGAGSIFIAGQYSSSLIDFGSMHLIGTTGNATAFVTAMDNAGNINGAFPANTNGAIASIAMGNSSIMTTGSFQKNPATFGVNNLINAGSADVFVAKLSGPDGINDINNTIHVLLYPNPVATTATIETDLNLNNGTFILWNMMGTIMQIHNQLYGNHFIVDCNNLPDGVYFLQLSDGSNANKNIKIKVGRE